MKELEAQLQEIRENETYKEHIPDHVAAYFGDIEVRLAAFKRQVAVNACVKERKKPFESGMDWQLERFVRTVRKRFI